MGLKGTALIINKLDSEMLVFWLGEKGEKRGELSIIDINQIGKITDFQIFGEKEEELGVLSDDGHLVIYKISLIGEEVKETGRIKVTRDSWESPEFAYKMSICGENKVIAVSTVNEDKSCSRVVILKKIQEEITVVNYYDFSSISIERINCIHFYGYFGGGHLILTIIPYQEFNSVVFTLKVSLKNWEISVIDKASCWVNDSFVVRVVKVGEKLVGCGVKGKVFGIEYGFNK